MRTLVYKRTHPGDPGEDGVFGCEDCMGTVRKRDFDAVIGVGGMGRETRSHRLEGKLHWIGVGPTRFPGEKWMRAPTVVFDRFVDYGADGPLLQDVAPLLAERFYTSRLRHMMDGFTEAEQAEIETLLKRAKKHARRSVRKSRTKSRCPPKRHHGKCP